MRKFVKRQDGSTAIEYGLLAGIISIAIVAAVDAIGQGSLMDYFQSVSDGFETMRQRVKS